MSYTAKVLALTVGLTLCWIMAPASAQRAPTQIVCTVLENGESATGTIRVLRGATVVHSGTCGGPTPVPAGAYKVIVGLDGALDGPEKTFDVTVRTGATENVRADFATGLLQVRIESEGQQAAGMAIVRRDGSQLGTLGSGVTAHLSVGTYQVVARYRLKSQEFGSVVITRGQTTTLDARF